MEPLDRLEQTQFSEEKVCPAPSGTKDHGSILGMCAALFKTAAELGNGWGKGKWKKDKKTFPTISELGFSWFSIQFGCYKPCFPEF